MNVYERRMERNKERILRATLELFKVHGIKKTTTNDIARKAGVSPATIYNHFGSKEELVRAAVKYFLTSTAADFSKIFKGGLSFLRKMEQILSYKSDMLGQYQGEFMQTIISEDPEIRHLVDSVYLTEIKQVIINFYEEGKRQGYVNPEMSTETIMRYMLIVRSGMAAESILSADPEQNRKMMQELTPLFLYGIMGKPRLDDQK
ncbi:MAG: TetR/AcrR family transcriptional regulator [Thermodesulfobacteriota bacterium]|nr:TetR/AcrR family transcriptional regulator [Thermodesulfobacteriota bacterium]